VSQMEVLGVASKAAAAHLIRHRIVDLADGGSRARADHYGPRPAGRHHSALQHIMSCLQILLLAVQHITTARSCASAMFGAGCCMNGLKTALTENMMQVLSWYTALWVSTAAVSFSTLPDSPVRMDWSHLPVQHWPTTDNHRDQRAGSLHQGCDCSICRLAGQRLCARV